MNTQLLTSLVMPSFNDAPKQEVQKCNMQNDSIKYDPRKRHAFFKYTCDKFANVALAIDGAISLTDAAMAAKYVARADHKLETQGATSSPHVGTFPKFRLVDFFMRQIATLAFVVPMGHYFPDQSVLFRKDSKSRLRWLSERLEQTS